MARLESAIKNIVDVFVEYANSDGKLNQAELKKLIDKEIENSEVKAKIQTVDLDTAMGKLDKNRDGEIDFREFSKCVDFMSKCLYRWKTGKGQECED
ncbi:protein S100-A1-like [Enoplosus armatus]|uniref:protein S100-A1-like n=1 Tax=Enoplosus armatus TaxID=215367 RepID=UPI003995D4AA